MSALVIVNYSDQQLDNQLHLQVQLIAAEAVLSHLSGRAPLRIKTANCQQVSYAIAPDLQALQNNRGLLEDIVMSASAAGVLARNFGLKVVTSQNGRQPFAILEAGLSNPEEQAVAGEYLRVLEARTAASIRKNWAEIQVVATGLLEHQQLNAQEISYRVQCAQGIRGSLLN